VREKAMEKVKVAVIGGSGLYQIDGIKSEDEIAIQTPFGNPSDKIIIGKLGEERIAFLPRHGKGHLYNPSSINYRANIFALKSLGVEQIISVAAVGSLKEEIKPGHFVIPDQIIDKTFRRPSTFFDEITVHAGFADPFCPDLCEILVTKGRANELIIHSDGTYVCMEGPLFSTRAESQLHRSWGAALIGMTLLPEAKLAREAEICYATIAIPTDYDCWYIDEQIDIEAILENLDRSLRDTRNLLKDILPDLLARHRECHCATALENAILTHPDHIPDDKKEEWAILIGKYLP
jgi:5'-methylthioadenosine phosphorylase